HNLAEWGQINFLHSRATFGPYSGAHSRAYKQHLIPTRVDGRVTKCFVFLPGALVDEEAAGEAL
ncbi:hypothetical protein ACWCQZ_45545, partial [Streptomyces sp. NPDC002285]